MAPYDSDSSDGEEEEFTETDVLLGYASSDAGAETVSRLGGRPEWLDPEKPPSAALARCKVCKDIMVLLLQLNGELPDRFPGHDRRLYVFSCKRKACRRKTGAVRALRGVRVDPGAVAAAAKKSLEEEKKKAAAAKKEAAPAPKPHPSSGLGDALFGVKPSGASGGNPFANPFSAGGGSTGANPFSTQPQAKPAANPFSSPQSPTAQKPEAKETKAPEPQAKPPPPVIEVQETFAQKLALNNPQNQAGPPPPSEPWPTESSQPAPYPVSWISEADYETLDPNDLPKVTQAISMETEEPGSSSGGGSGKEDKEVFESAMDTAFQKFADRVGQNPDQVIRYEYGGNPLLYGKDDAIGKALGGGAPGEKVATAGGIPRCTNCGAGRVFEVQLTPNAITELEMEEDGLDGMDWGTIIVGVCSQNCQERGISEGEAGYMEEWAGVQWEELTSNR